MSGWNLNQQFYQTPGSSLGWLVPVVLKVASEAEGRVVPKVVADPVAKLSVENLSDVAPVLVFVLGFGTGVMVVEPAEPGIHNVNLEFWMSAVS